MDADRVALCLLLLSVPGKVVKHLHRVAQSGYDKLRTQLEAAEGMGGGGAEGDPEQVRCRCRSFVKRFVVLCGRLAPNPRSLLAPGPCLQSFNPRAGGGGRY